jgi:predicted metal-dependent HD superfamily phosphohydrolase
MLKQLFIDLAQRYSSDDVLVETLWKEIEKRYSEKGRHYHTLTHLENLFHEVSNVKSAISDWDSVLFSLFYHDIVYNTLKQDNESKSAELARERLVSLDVSLEKIKTCCDQILATKGHAVSSENDTNLFTDADLSILGKDWSSYSVYANQIRKEYSLYPSLVYNPGRKNVLQHFLNMDRIFKTDFFYGKYERQARENLIQELNSL